jgi:hypothetical protein
MFLFSVIGAFGFTSVSVPPKKLPPSRSSVSRPALFYCGKRPARPARSVPCRLRAEERLKPPARKRRAFGRNGEAGHCQPARHSPKASFRAVPVSRDAAPLPPGTLRAGRAVRSAIKIPPAEAEGIFFQGETVRSVNRFLFHPVPRCGLKPRCGKVRNRAKSTVKWIS